MYIEFATNRLANIGTNLEKAIKLFGVEVGRKYIQRLAVLKAVDNFHELYGHRALRLHPLKGKRAGQYSIKLTGNFRLVISRIEENKVCILEVEDYHGN